MLRQLRNRGLQIRALFRDRQTVLFLHSHASCYFFLKANIDENIHNWTI